ncbi:DUF6221 family protein [Streptomyces sp. NBC_00178]|uniref:DUF6221 family protein n=1 Tax=Streptomyces sp. NBC_00178 TaxID=2975672 RepID=UPI003FA6F0CD
MTDLVALPRARLDEDGRVVRACPGDSAWTAWALDAYGPDLSDVVRAHAARHGPARILRRSRRSGDPLSVHARSMPGWCTCCDVPGDYQGRPHGCTTVRLLAAAVYADHPGYCQEWVP